MKQAYFLNTSEDYARLHINPDHVEKKSKDSCIRLCFSLKDDSGAKYSNPFTTSMTPMYFLLFLWLSFYSGKGEELMAEDTLYTSHLSHRV